MEGERRKESGGESEDEGRNEGKGEGVKVQKWGRRQGISRKRVFAICTPQESLLRSLQVDVYWALPSIIWLVLWEGLLPFLSLPHFSVSSSLPLSLPPSFPTSLPPSFLVTCCNTTLLCCDYFLLPTIFPPLARQTYFLVHFGGGQGLGIWLMRGIAELVWKYVRLDTQWGRG